MVYFYTGGVSENSLGFADIGVGDGDVASLGGLAVDDGFFAERFFDKFDEAMEGDGLGFTEVEDFVSDIFCGAGHDAVHNVRDVGVIPCGAAIAENGDGFAIGDEPGEFMDGKVGSLTWAVHGE